jgi:tripartite-type tricarboxylate transporter receptor subunit TctC
MILFLTSHVNTRRLLKPLFGMLISTAFGVASAQTASFPSGPINIIVGFPPGGSNDVIARTLAPKLSEILGVNVVVENKAGANGAIGTAYTVNSKPDGQTITLGSTSVFSIGPHTAPRLPYKLSDLTAINTVAMTASMLAVNSTVTAKTIQDLIDLSKKRQISIASSGAGGISHLNIEFIKQQTGADFLHVAYKGATPAITDVISGQVDGIIMDYSALAGMMAQGRIRAIASSKAVAGIEASPMVISPWYGVMAPAKTPRSTIKTLFTALNKAANEPDIKTKFEKLGVDVFNFPSPEEADNYIRADSERWNGVVKDSGLKFE